MTMGVLACGALPAHATVRLHNPYWDAFQLEVDVTFSWRINAGGEFTPWWESGGSESSVPAYVDIENEGCGCPDGYSPPCYKVADEDTAQWEPW